MIVGSVTVASFIGQHGAPKLVGQVSFEATQRSSWRFAIGDLAVVVASSGAIWHAHLDDGDGVKSRVQLSVAVAVEPVAVVFGAGDLDWGGAVVGGIGGRGGKPADVTGSAEDAGSQHRADAVDLAQSRALLVEQPGGLGLIVGQLLVESADIGDQLPASCSRIRSGRCCGAEVRAAPQRPWRGSARSGRRRPSVPAAARAVG